MDNSKFENILQDIGHILSNDIEYPLSNTLLHAEVTANMVGPSIFKDLGDHILYRETELDPLSDALLELWFAAPPKKRWAEIEYVIRNDKFEVKFIYPDEIAPRDIEDPLDRRDRIVREYFGNKPIVYPPFDSDEGIQFES